MMRRLATIFLLLVFASSFTELGQLWKLPFLVQHFYTHQQQEGATISHFLLEHYGNEHDDADRSQDRQLPFKSNLDAPTVNVITGITRLDIPPAERPAAPKYISRHTPFVPSLFAGQIFHPPRAV